MVQVVQTQCGQVTLRLLEGLDNDRGECLALKSFEFRAAADEQVPLAVQHVALPEKLAASIKWRQILAVNRGSHLDAGVPAAARLKLDVKTKPAILVARG